MKGAILAACPEATIVDLVHELPAHDVMAGALVLAAACRAFPAGTVFLVVVDPGVGSPRRSLALEAGGYRFVGPDNGLFTLVLAELAPLRVHAITNAGLFRHEVSPVFHGRDVFAPVAARLAAGLPLAEVGPEVSDPVRLPFEKTRRLGDAEWEATVLHVDRFGNLTTSLTAEELAEAAAAAPGGLGDLVAVMGGVTVPLARTYSDVAEGEVCALLGSSGRLEIAVHRGNAARHLGAGRGARLRLRRAPHFGA
jgi:S-adenosylmethionine hydrolase